MIPDWQTNKVYFSGRLEIDYSTSHANILNALNTLQIEPLYLTDTKDVWARDYMPIQLEKINLLNIATILTICKGKVKGTGT